PLIPGDPELSVALRAPHIEGVARDRRAGAANGADRVAGAPMIRHVLGMGGARHDGPVARPGEERLQKAPRDADALAPRHLENRVLRREPHHAIPGTPPEATAHVLVQTGPGTRQGLVRWF